MKILLQVVNWVMIVVFILSLMFVAATEEIDVFTFFWCAMIIFQSALSLAYINQKSTHKPYTKRHKK